MDPFDLTGEYPAEKIHFDSLSCIHSGTLGLKGFKSGYNWFYELIFAYFFLIQSGY